MLQSQSWFRSCLFIEEALAILSIISYLETKPTDTESHIHCLLENAKKISKILSLQWWLLPLYIPHLSVKLQHNASEWCRSQYWFKQWLGAVRYQGIAWTNVDPYLCRHMGSPGRMSCTETVYINQCSSRCMVAKDTCFVLWKVDVWQ